MFLLVSVLAGILVAGLAIPAAALTGVTSTTVSDSLRELPAEFETPPVAERTTFYLANGTVFARFYDENRVIVSLDEISPIMQKAQVAIEDDRFYSHGALDFKALLKATLTYFGSDDGGGGSTLTQQYVKQVQIEQAATISDPEQRAIELEAVQERSVERKVKEARYALALESRLSKDTILNNYLNIAYYGDGAYGIEAAAHHYYNTTAAQLTLDQAAMLAGIVQTPARNPVDDLEGSLERREVVLDRMVELEIITKQEAEEAKAVEFDPDQIKNVPNGCASSKYSILCEFVRRTLMQNPALGDSAEERSRALLRGGYHVQTLIDPKLQDAVQSVISKKFDPRDPVIASLVYVEPGTGHILAMAQNRYQLGVDFDAGETGYVFTADQSLGGAEGFQAGSTFKAFTAAAALDMGIPPSKTFRASANMQFGGKPFKTCEGEVTVPSFQVHNTSPSGVMNMYYGAAQSVNTYFVQLEQMTGICAPATIAQLAGVKLGNGDDMLNKKYIVPSWTLGVLDVSPLSMATAYATFAARGKHCDPIIISSITDPAGNEVPTQQANCEQVIKKEVADAVNAVLGNVFTYGTVGTGGGIGRPASGKSGTTESNRAAWFMGYTPNVVGAATISIYQNPKFEKFWKANHNTLQGTTLPYSKTRLSGIGSWDAHAIWKPGIQAVLKGRPVKDFHAPSSEILNGKPIKVPAIADGVTAKEARRILEADGFFVQEKKVFDESPPGTFKGYNCEKYLGGTCTLSISKGPRPEPPTTPETPPGEETGG